jgi:hypothetical protein
VEFQPPEVLASDLSGQLQVPAVLSSDKQLTISNTNKGYSKMVGLDTGEKYSSPSGIDSSTLLLNHSTGRIDLLTPELNPSAQRCLTRFLPGILLLEP